MALKIFSYNNGNDLRKILNSLVKNSDTETRFIIPSRKDKIWWYKLINNKNSKRDYELWTWQNIYFDIMNFNSQNPKSILSPPDHFMILKNILNSLLNELPEQIKSWPGIERAGFPELLSNDIRELLNENIKPEDLQPLLNQDDPPGFLLPEIYARYLNYLENNNLLDSAQIYTAAFEAIKLNSEWGKNLKIIFTGFLSFTHGQLELVREIQKRVKEIVLVKPEAELKNFHDINFQFDTYAFNNNNKISRGKILEIPVAEPALEPEFIARTLALWAAGEHNVFEKNFTSFDDIGIMLPENYKNALERALTRYEIPFNPDSGVKISNTLPGLVLGALKNLSVRNFPTYDTALLLSQKIFAGGEFDINRAYRAGAYGLDGWLNYLRSINSEKAFLAVTAIKNFFNALSKKNKPAKIMQAFYNFLTAPNLWLYNLNDDVNYLESDEAIRNLASAIETVREKVIALNELTPDLGHIQDVELNHDDAFNFLETWCQNSLTRAPIKLTNSVSIFTKTPPVLATFPIWIMAGVTQRTWSGNIQSSPLLGNSERDKLSQNEIYVPALQDKAVQHEALFRRLIHTGENLTVITRPELDEEERPVTQSNFMIHFPEDYPAWEIKTLPSAGINILAGGDNYIFDDIECENEEPKINRFAPVMTTKLNALGVSDLKKFLTCPLEYYLNKRAELYPASNVIVSPLEFGNMAHKFWERVWQKLRASKNITGENFKVIANSEWEILKSCTDKNYEKYSRLIKDFRLKRLMAGHEFRIKRLINVQAEIIDNLHAAGYIHENIWLETEAQMSYTLKGIKFLGQCDRIEILREKSSGLKFAVITDYKEGESKASENSFKIQNYAWNTDGREKFRFGLQISAYALLFHENYPEINLGGAYFLGLKDGTVSGSFILGLQEVYKPYAEKLSPEISSRIQESFYAMECAATILNSRLFRAYYIDKMHCSWCGLKSLCRKGEIRGDSFSEDSTSDFEDE